MSVLDPDQHLSANHGILSHGTVVLPRFTLSVLELQRFRLCPSLKRLSGHGTQGKHSWIIANIGEQSVIVKGTLGFRSSWSIQRSESCVPLFRQYRPSAGASVIA